MSDTQENRAKRPSLFLVALVVLCLGLTVTAVALVLQNRDLREHVSQLMRRVQAAERSALADGDPFPAVTLLDPSGASTPFPAEGEPGPALLLLSSSSCEYCDDVRPTWEELDRLVRGSGLAVLELMVDAVPEDLLAGARSHPVFAPAGDASALVRRLPGVPAAILVDADGNVRRSFYGAEQTGLQAAVQALLSGEQ